MIVEVKCRGSNVQDVRSDRNMDVAETKIQKFGIKGHSSTAVLRNTFFWKFDTPPQLFKGPFMWPRQKRTWNMDMVETKNALELKRTWE